MEKNSVGHRLRGLLPEYYSPTACLYHYLHMARGNFKEYLRGETVWIKKYFYVLRPLLAIRWIEEGRGVVPMEFETLLAGVDCEQDFKLAVSGLLERKIRGEELDRGSRIPEISDFIEREMGRLVDKRFERRGLKPPIDGLNEILRLCVREAWV
jgi:predicted nucleotidyltransferase